MAFISFLTAILATYRLARLLPYDDGPFFVFGRIRDYIEQKAMEEGNRLGRWANLYAFVTCPYCCGLYAAFFVAALVFWNNFYGNLFILILAIAGGQSFLQSLGGK